MLLFTATPAFKQLVEGTADQAEPNALYDPKPNADRSLEEKVSLQSTTDYITQGRPSPYHTQSSIPHLPYKHIGITLAGFMLFAAGILLNHSQYHPTNAYKQLKPRSVQYQTSEPKSPPADPIEFVVDEATLSQTQPENSDSHYSALERGIFSPRDITILDDPAAYENDAPKYEEEKIEDVWPEITPQQNKSGK